MARLIRRCLWINFAWIVVLSAFAQNAAAGPFYVGITGGRSFADAEPADFESGPGPAWNVVRQSNDRSWSVHAGYQLNPAWALEAGYASHGSFRHQSDGVDRAVYTFDTKAQSWFAAIKANAPITQRLSAFGKAGVSFNRLQTRIVKNEPYVEPHGFLPGFYMWIPGLAERLPSGTYRRQTDALLIGAGFSYAMTNEVRMSIGYESFGRAGDASSTGRMRLARTYAAFDHSF